ncbi:MAG TPA: cytochrome c biogenesis CcdA family protein [Acetobacteraceae bacterium]|nr:cytochrome c biogenesis CcdA family protein [Acetobacteraceae bacterium]
MTPGSIALGFAAGLLSILSPCVLPLLPLILGAAAAQHRFGTIALAAGLVLSFVGIGLFVATVGFAIGLDGGVFRAVAAVLLAALGAVLLSERLQQRFALAGGGISDAGHRLLARITPAGPGGQFALGLLLGAVWSPCVGPTLGTASVLAAQGRDLAQVAAVMLAFGVGAAIPLLVLGRLSRQAFTRLRGGLTAAGRQGKALLGGGALLIAALILTGADRQIEAALVAASPPWLTRLTTQF